MSGKQRRAAEVVLRAAHGDLGQDGIDMAALMREGAKMNEQAQQTARAERDRADRAERDAWALSYVLAEIMNGADVNDVIDDLPHDVRRRVIAVRHRDAGVPGTPIDQFGQLPTPPARASVMRDRVRIIDV